MSIKENVNIIVNKKNKIFYNTEYRLFKSTNIINKDYKYDLFIGSTDIMKSLNVDAKNKQDIKDMLALIDNGKFYMNGHGYHKNGRYYTNHNCDTLQEKYKSFSGKYDASIKELNERINGLINFANTAEDYFNNAKTKLETAKHDSDNIIFKDHKEVKSKIDDCIDDCNSTIKKLDYIINNL